MKSLKADILPHTSSHKSPLPTGETVCALPPNSSRPPPTGNPAHTPTGKNHESK